ncbi:MAG: lysine-2,3-aminomutase-like protein [Alphaproteobacteria bacterium]|nr:lysine-2,3-aminomutase-like protein [Alphaproteobacteria bacterium]
MPEPLRLPLARTLRDASALADAGLVPREAVPGLDEVAARYAIAVTPAVAALVDPGDPLDPVARQYVPTAEELVRAPEDRDDPIGDRRHAPVPGLVHRHRDRVLLLLHHSCPVYCRFCFRREVVGPGGPALVGEALDAALAYVAAHEEIWEVVLTGGDPFMVSPARAREVTARLAAIPHVKVLRWHTRVPVAAPERVSEEFAAALKCDRAVFVAVHANHPRELTPEARAACRRLVAAGHSLVSQSVLLRGVNDDVATLEALMRALVETGIKPYYLHHPDLAPGTAHFRLSIEEGRALADALRARVSGLGQPTYVLDVPDGYGKVPLGRDVVLDGAVRDLAGETRPYPPPPTG